MADKVVLFSYYRSSASWRLRIALAMKKIKYEYKAVHLAKGEQISEEYKKINPMGQVPTLEIDGVQLTQSMAVLEYLEERNPEPALLPKDKISRAKVRALCEIVNSGIQPLQNRGVLQKVGEGKAEWANFFNTKGLTALEELMKETAGKYSCGDEVTMADLCLVPQVYGAKRFNVDMAQFPIISRVHSELMKLPAFIEADFSRQPDTPEDQRSS